MDATVHLPHSISVGTSIHTQYPRHIHPDSITVGTSIHIQYPAAHPSTLNRCRHILTSTLILRRQIHPYSISFGTSIHPQYRLAHTIIHLSTQYLWANQFLLILSLMVNTCKKKIRAPRANSLRPYCTWNETTIGNS